MTDTRTLRVMPREMRLMSERILSLTDLPKGYVLAVCDVVMVSEAMALGGFALLLDRLDGLMSADPSRIVLEGDRLDGGGQHAWFVVPSLLDLLGLAVARGEAARIEVANVLDPSELRIAEGLAGRQGLKLHVTEEVVVAEAAPVADPLLDRLMQEGCQIPAELWWQVYDRAQTALTPDSVVSRRHAGPVIVTDDGKVIGRKDNDDDTDVNFIASVATSRTQEHTA